jgi:hypothetical protein
MLTPRAADDFEVIRGRLEELRRERARASSDRASSHRASSQTGDGPVPDRGAARSEWEPQTRRLPRAVRQRLFG